MKQQLLLINDVDGLGRSGDVVTAKPGFIRNFLLPKRHAVVADKHTLKMQAKLKEEREKRAAVDRKASEEIAAKLAELVIEVETKIDRDGKMYGSVTQHEMVKLLVEKGFELERKNITLPQAIKKLGKHEIPMRLKENVPASFTLHVKGEGGVEVEQLSEVVAPIEEQAATEQASTVEDSAE